MNMLTKLKELYNGLRAFFKTAKHVSTQYGVKVPVTGRLDIATGVFGAGKNATIEVKSSIAAFDSADNLKVVELSNAIYNKHGVDMVATNIAIMKAFARFADKVCVTDVSFDSEADRGYAVLTKNPILVKNAFVLEHKARLQASALVMDNGEAAVIRNARILLWKEEKSEATWDGNMVTTIDALGVTSNLVPEMNGHIPLTIRMLGMGNGRLGKAHLTVVPKSDFELLFNEKFGRDWTANDPMIIGPTKTVKGADNDATGTEWEVDVMIHKVNAKGALSAQGVDFKESLENDYQAGVLAKIMAKIEKKANKIVEQVSSKESLVSAIKGMDMADLAKDKNGDTDHAAAKKLTAFRDLIAAGMNPALWKKEVNELAIKMLMKASTFNEMGIRIANEGHDGDIVDGERFWIQLPKTTVQIVVDGEIKIGDWCDIKTGKHMRRIELFHKTNKTGWLKIKRSPVTRGAWLIPMSNILWTEESQTMRVCAAISAASNADQDGDTFTITWENPVVVRQPNATWTSMKKASESLIVKIGEVAKTANLYADVKEAIVNAGLDINGPYAKFVIGEFAADSIGLFSNIALDYYERHESKIISSVSERNAFLAIVDAMNEGVIKAVKHTDKANFWNAEVARRILGVPVRKDESGTIRSANQLLRKKIDEAIVEGQYRNLETEACSILKPVASAFKNANLGWIDLMDEKAAIAGIENAMKNMVKREPGLFNQKTGSFSSIHDILSMKPGLRSYNITFNMKANAIMPKVVDVLAKNGNQENAMNDIRMWDIENSGCYPVCAIVLLARLWNATRPNSKVALFNSGRSMIEEWAVVAEWIRLSSK